ncbi:zinc ABC transporter substrate-binding protein [Hoeflea sp.]|uniref:zinc ABC transporter substrate-binding protein n=1 Tax=Hoeflea sp. TaxID=1940281 RepID=UPI003BB1F54F
MNRLRGLLLASTLIVSSATSASADVNVVASIKPVHSLVAAVMEGVGEPGLIIEGAGSPHTYALRPSQARMLEQADVVFWIGHELEAFLGKPLETIGANASSVELIDAHGLVTLGFREGGAFDKHDHGDDAGHDDHAHETAAEAEGHHAHEAEAGHDHAHEETGVADHDHDHGAFDAHVWLDPVNARVMVHEIEEALVEADPANAAKYKANAEAVTTRIETLIAEVSAELEPVKDRSFIVFHDGYQYFENRFGITASGSITVSPEVMPGAERITEIRERVEELGAACVFAEPQFEPKLVSTVIEGTGARAGTIDPLGAGLDDGPELYFQLIGNMATSISTCLSDAG